ncbi:MAG TPA: 2-hydroxychromene-2-carboxylate isomerase [Pseudolabrys sp.]|jgi:2-hydroxychromene-2-carboxylate isomerase|nr:2-hydroxychromene-2-carboxylate isomerase [Pseudolabrys sp.]
MPGTPTLDFWFEFASTYSYPAGFRIGALARDRGVLPRWRPFLLGPVFKAQGWDNSPFNIYPAKGRYMWRDLERVCDGLRIPFVRPAVFPQNTILASRVALVALAEGWGEEFCRAAYAAEFGEGRDIGLTDTVAAVLSAVGRDAASVIELAQADANKLALRKNTEEAQALGIFGAPSFVTADGELFWGNDRLEAALDWARTPSPRLRGEGA